MNTVTLELDGPGTIAGVGNGDHQFPAEFDTNRVDLFYGKAMVIVRSQDQDGRIRVRANSDGLSSEKIPINSVKARAE